MKLQGEDGAMFDLTIDGYQFPEIETDYWDSNWLMVRGQVNHPRGNWIFRDPCLTTFELEQLAIWLDGVANGVANPADGYFTEPNLHFEYVTIPVPAIQVTFGYESAPPWLATDDARLDGAIVRFPLALNDLRVVSRSLRADLVKFPIRGVPDGSA
jgi:hypothetical protein